MVSEKKSRKTNPFTIATNKHQHKQKEQKPFGKNLTWDVKDLQNKNFKILKKLEKIL